MSRSADARVRLVAASSALLVLGVPAAARADAPDEPRETVAEVKGGEVAEAPILELSPPVLDIEGPIDDLTFATEDADGAITDAENDEERVVTLAADVLFEFDQADISDDAEEALQEAADILLRDADGKTVDIDGYTDAKGDDAHNQALSEDRAKAVEKKLSELVGDDADVTFSVSGHGSADPVAPNEIDGKDNPEGRKMNRRVEISFPR
ncbi:OmpA family protein [Nocardiopsis gilva YIM 90087]|uniref:OmpA family protein n=1 Tax=Nocardiopsis gilva YIM 90087 TaxID=1235441 RepID=A0A223S9W8_9ACTN|nr:OmpA family protein [Nocardiopsis gilva]ASU84893.1 OmpA family protein [Nocardiopsis gilva YIM 90087]